MLLPVLLIFLAALAGALMAYGTHPAWAGFSHGLGVILFTRRFEWPLAAIAMILCIVLIGLVVAGKRRAWWLIGLGPILALFVHRYQTDPLRRLAILENPQFVPAEQAKFLDGADYVVGLTFEGNAYTYPYHALYAAPVVIQADHDKRMILIWSALANRAVASHINHDLRAVNLEIVSTPDCAVLLYNTQVGQFINGVTGLTNQSKKPMGFLSPIYPQKMAWRDWLAAHPAAMVMAPPPGARADKIPNAPLLPMMPRPAKNLTPPPQTPVTMICTTQPVLIRTDSLPSGLTNLAAPAPLLLFRDSATHQVHAFDRRVEDLTLKFRINTDARRKQAVLIDQETNSGWTIDGRAVDGPMGKDGKRLIRVPVDDGLWWGVMKRWMPQLQLVDVPPPPPERQSTRPPAGPRPPRRTPRR